MSRNNWLKVEEFTRGNADELFLHSVLATILRDEIYNIYTIYNIYLHAENIMTRWRYDKHTRKFRTI